MLPISYINPVEFENLNAGYTLLTDRGILECYAGQLNWYISTFQRKCFCFHCHLP